MSFSILIVEPDFLALDTISAMLNFTGYRTMNVQSAEMALGALQAISIDVAIFSSTAEDPNGAHFALAAKRIQPALKVVLADGRDAVEGWTPYVDARVHKPFLSQELTSVVRQLCHIKI